MAAILVAPRAGAWIEMWLKWLDLGLGQVAPRAGAWIEIILVEVFGRCLLSLPVRERGLKSAAVTATRSSAIVAPRAGAWIEIDMENYVRVAIQESLPVRERGLKYMALAIGP